MKNAISLYNQAVHYAELADIAKIKSTSVDYKSLYNKASNLQKEAALLLNDDDMEPLNKTAMLRSAAALAYKASNFAESEILIRLARLQKFDAYEAAKLDEIEAALQNQLLTQC
jgi:hypothetical protein